MPPPDALRPGAARRPRGLSVRVKLALSYAGFLVIAGVALFVVGFLLLRYVPEGNLQVPGGPAAPNRSDLLEVFVKYAWWALGLLVVLGLVGGWLLAGFVLRPLQRITDVARLTRDGSLDRRVDLPGPRDELTDLADAFDAMLVRVQHTLDEERRFAANASHELRTPLAIIRTMVEVGQADPGGRDIEVLLQRIGTTNDRAIAITESLLALARVGRGGGLARERVDLAAVVRDAIDDVMTDAAASGIRIDTSLAPAVTIGDRTLLGQVAANLARNAVAHNVDGGRLFASTAVAADGRAVLLIANSGPIIDPAVAATLTEPFVRGAGRTRHEGGEGSGLGLAIVSSIVRAHDGAVDVSARPEGGLQVRVTLPGPASVTV
ncbi:HAMP domain-containing sensor histidine kinase [Microbacterium sp. CFBP9034]|uniref:sensor histidine kinase n=1 Tax=Microbacterium sp. CFBP9034 TaxID=3096540 RepID=UPI002A6B5A92|nr:HAMP domain-containing sensor histidine kinase [Microbacterium sp. CFBP9034]MDY0910661.1 HAMP domain-containing sensor histidine kinase [Microbacterium sp. CFBP9034]